MPKEADRHRFSLRKMEEADLPTILEIERASYPSPWGETAFLGEIRGADTSYPLVAVCESSRTEEDENLIVGFVCCWMVRDLMQINNLAVAETFRGQGLGRELLSAVLEEGKKREVTSCFLDVRPSNHPARALYQSFGFYEVGVRKGYYSDTKEDAIVMRLDFPNGKNPS